MTDRAPRSTARRAPSATGRPAPVKTDAGVPRANTRRSVRTAPSQGQLVTLRPNGQITLPAELRQRVGARSGDVFIAELREDVVVLRPKKLIDAADAWFWTREWQEGEREADDDIAAGRVSSVDSVEELIASLKR